MLGIILVLGGLLSYVGSIPSYVGYFIVVFGIFYMIHAGGKIWSTDSATNILSSLYGASSIISVIFNASSSYGDIFQTLIYPVTFYLICINWRNIIGVSSRSSYIILFIFVINGVIALFSSVFYLQSIPIIGDITTGRYIFFTNLRSSAGILWNLNYFSISQACGFWFLFLISKYSEINGRIFSIGMYFVGFSVIFGSSRSISFAFIISIVIFMGLSNISRRLYFIIIFVVSAIWIYQFGGFEIELDDINQTLRVERGLNSRDEIWVAAISVFYESPIFGLGSPQRISEALIINGSPTTAMQNGYLLTIVRLGILGFLPVFLIFLLGTWRGIMGSKNAITLAAFSGFLLLSVDSLVRSYSLGGVGWAPLALSIFLGIILDRKFSTRPLNI